MVDDTKTASFFRRSTVEKYIICSLQGAASRTGEGRGSVLTLLHNCDASIFCMEGLRKSLPALECFSHGGEAGGVLEKTW